MSHSIFIEESNGNGIYVIKTSNSLNSSSASVLPTSISCEDLSQSLSEYTDADESMSAPTEFLSEFLSAVMLKDYKKGLKYCKLILQYEPDNATAKEFYPLIKEKLRSELTAAEDSDENDNKSSSPELGIEDMKLDDDGVDQDCVDDDGDGAGEGDGDDDDDEENQSSACSEEGSAMSSSSSSSINCYSDVATSDDSDENIMENLNSNDSSGSGRGGNGGGSVGSDNTTHSYSSLLLEEDEEEATNHLHLNELASNVDANNGNIIPASCSDSESPTEPLTQRIAAILRSKCVPEKEN